MRSTLGEHIRLQTEIGKGDAWHCQVSLNKSRSYSEIKYHLVHLLIRRIGVPLKCRES